MIKIALRTAHGTYLSAHKNGGFISAHATEIGPWELWEVVDVGDVNKAAFKSAHGKYLCAEEGGGRELIANRSAVGSWETFGYWQRDGLASLQSASGLWVRVGDAEEGFQVSATDPDEPAAWETFTKVEVEAPGGNHPDALQGPLLISHNGWRANGALKLPLFCHAGDLFMAFTEGKNVDEPLDRIRDVGYHGVRFWVPLVWRPENSPFWGNRACSPVHTPDFYGKLRQFLQKLFDRQLIAYPSCGGLKGASNNEETEYYENLANLMGEFGSERFFLPGEVNESRDTGDSDDRDPREVERLVNILRNRHPNVSYALSGYTGDTPLEDMKAWTPGWMPFYYFHGYRDGHYWDKVRHMVNNGYEYYKAVRKYGFVGEDVGPGQWVSVTANKHELDASTMGLIGTAAAIGGIGYTYICSPGIIFDEPFDNMPGFASLPAVYRRLPQDLMSYETQHHSGNAWNHLKVFSAINDFRVDGRLASDGRFLYVAYGPNGSVVMPVVRTCVFDVIDPSNGETVQAGVHKNAGESFHFNYHRGVILDGRLA